MVKFWRNLKFPQIYKLTYIATTVKLSGIELSPAYSPFNSEHYGVLLRYTVVKFGMLASRKGTTSLSPEKLHEGEWVNGPD